MSVMFAILLAGIVAFVRVAQHRTGEAGPAPALEPVDVLCILLGITAIGIATWLALALLARIRDAPSSARLVVTDRSMVFNGYHRYPRDSVVHLYAKPLSCLMMGLEGRLVGAVDGQPSESLVFAVDLERGGADWYEIPVRLKGEQLTLVLEGLRGCLPGLIVSARPDW